VQCLIASARPETVVVWPDPRAGEIFILNVLWNGTTEAHFDETPFPSVGELIKTPSSLKPKFPERIYWKKPAAAAALLEMRVGGTITTFRTAGESVPVRWQATEVVGPKLSAQSFHVSGTVC
jgi:hypothetical protein